LFYLWTFRSPSRSSFPGALYPADDLTNRGFNRDDFHDGIVEVLKLYYKYNFALDNLPLNSVFDSVTLPPHVFG